MRLLVVLVPVVVVLVVVVLVLVLRAGARPAAGPAADGRRRALSAQARFHGVVGHIAPGPLRDRVEHLGASVDAAAAEAVRVSGIVAALPDHGDSAPLQRLELLVSTLERSVVVAGELAVAGGDELARLSDEIDALRAALGELGPGR